MNEPTDKHAPTDEFVEYLARDTMRRLRHETRFSTAGALPARRLPIARGITAGVVMTLATGMVLGASANYASAEVLPNGTTTIPARPALALLPIRNALSAIGCTQAAPSSVSAARSADVVVPPREPAVVDQLANRPARSSPDRATIAAYAAQYQPAVVRGDTASEYIVMVLDASQNHLWSTHGNGNLSIEVAGDVRTAAERAEYAHAHRADYLGAMAAVNITSIEPSLAGLRGASGAQILHPPGDSAIYDLARRNGVPDSVVRRLEDSVANLIARGAGGARSGSIGGVALRHLEDSTLFQPRNVRRGRLEDGLNGGLGVTLMLGADPITARDGTYRIGWRSGRATTANTAFGLAEAGGGQSGIDGVVSTALSMGEVYLFPPGELSPQLMRIVVVHLVPGASWRGR